MAKSRTAKSTGLIPFRLPSLTPGPLGHNDAGSPDSPRSMLADTAGSLGMFDHAAPARRSSFSLLPEGNRLLTFAKFDTFSIQANPWFMSRIVFVTEEDEKEFDLLKDKITDRDVAEYVKSRNSFFGSSADYLTFAQESDKELDESKNLRKLIELHGDAQTVFYRWVRKGYVNKGYTNIPAMIRAGMSEELKSTLADVRTKYKDGFKAGGFNPRPMKINGRYRLGTISEHATGMAVDIEDHSNAQFDAREWLFIEKLADKKANLDLSNWSKHPKAIWQDVKDVNDAFVEKVKSEVKRIEEENAKAKKEVAAGKAGEKKKKELKPLDIIFKDMPSVKQWANGFFTLPSPLVEQLHDHEFRWGATFFNRASKTGNVDLHHFELSE